MEETKREIKYFTIVQWKQEQEYLQQQHNAGWRFVRVSGLCCYHFQRCQPEDVVYQLDYNPEGRAHRGAYVQMFRDCGWEYLQDYMGYSYFRKPAAAMAGQEEIFCDDASRQAFLERVFKGRMVPLLALFFCLFVPQAVALAGYDDGAGKVVLGLYVLLMAVYVLQFYRFFIQFRGYQRTMK